MTHPEPACVPASDAIEEFEPLLERFEADWLAGKPPSIGDYLNSCDVADDDGKRRLLEELTFIDLECRWRRWGTTSDEDSLGVDLTRHRELVGGLPLRVHVEDYLEEFSELETLSGQPLSLLTEEYRVRHRWGDRPGHAEYCERFAPLAGQIEAALAAVDEDHRREGSNKDGPGEKRAARRTILQNLLDEGEPTRDAVDEVGRNETFSAGKDATETLRESLIVAPQYEGLQFHAQGGLGEVFMAQDQALHRDVALKFIRRRHAYDLDSRSRFLLEAEVTARLEHPGVVPVHAIGHTAEDRPFYVMRFIKGQTLQEAIAEFHSDDGKLKTARQNLMFRDLLMRFVSVCNTIAYAHNRGIVHRDIKPENVMFGKYGETLVVDWGLAVPVGRDERAKATGERTLKPSSESSASDSGGIAGTPAYMSPEQARQVPSLTPASDIYSLGATLYKLLTGETPIKAGDVRAILDKVTRGVFPRPSETKRNVPPPLEAICLKAMALEPEDRYATAVDMADDITHWLADEPVSVYREPIAHRLARWTRRHRSWALASAVTGLVVIALATLAAAWLGRMANNERDARVAADHARVAAERARQTGVRMAARFAAKTVANEIDLRWRVLEFEAADPMLRNFLTAGVDPGGDDETWNQLKNWLNERFILHGGTTKATSWFINDARGVQLARAPLNRKTLGENYRFRDYFHGHGRDYSPEEAERLQPKPIERVHRSTVFESQANGNLMVAFSVPIWGLREQTGEPLGILAMTVELGQFSVLQSGLGEDQLAALVETRADWTEEAPLKGLILHHRRLEDLASAEEPASSNSYRLDASRVERLEALRKLRLRQLASENGARRRGEETLADELDWNYRDPTLGDANNLWLAAFEPVLVQGRPEEVQDTGWVVIVQERRDLRPSDGEQSDPATEALK